jgi:hypothetical protein
VAPRHVRLVVVDYSPDGDRAVVFLEDDEPRGVEAYIAALATFTRQACLERRSDSKRLLAGLRR